MAIGGRAGHSEGQPLEGRAGVVFFLRTPPVPRCTPRCTPIATHPLSILQPPPMTEPTIAIVAGLLPVGCDRVAAALEELGWRPVSVEPWHQAVLRAQGFQESGWVTRQPEPVSALWIDRLGQLCRRWPTGPVVVADALATLFLSDWQTQFPTARFVLVSCAPWVGVSALFRAAGDRALEDPEWALRVWQTYHEALLVALEQLGDRAILVDLAAGAVEWGQETLILPDWEAIADERQALFQHFYPTATALYQQLNARALAPHPQLPIDPSAPTDALTWLQDWALAEQTRDRQGQFRQLQQQLAQLQPALAQSQFQLEQTRADLSRYQARVLTAEQGAIEGRLQVDQYQALIGTYDSRLQCTEDLLQAANQDLESLRDQIADLHEELELAELEVKHGRQAIARANELRDHAKAQIAAAQDQFRELRSRLEETRRLLDIIRSSKFWALRNFWIKLKYKLRPPAADHFDPELFARTLVALSQIPPELAIAPDPAAQQSAIYEAIKRELPTLDLRKPHALLRLFDAAYYLETQPDVANCLPNATYSQAFTHFVANGATEGRDPSPLFKTRYYLETYPQVKARLAAKDFNSAIEHFLEVGMAEGLNPNPNFDSEFYLQTYGDAALAVELGQYRSAFEHFLLVGVREGRLAAVQVQTADDRPIGMFAFISGCGGAPYRYRCLHQAEALRYLGYSVEVYDIAQYPYRELLDQYRAVVMHRPTFHPNLESAIEEGRKQGVRFVFETDDLVFDPDLLYQLEDANSGEEELRQVYKEMMHQYQRAIARVDGVSTSTANLKRSIEQRFPGTPVALLPNRASAEMERQAAETLAAATDERDRSVVRLGYLSGTKTHQRDFAECEAALQVIATRYPQARLLVVGHLELSADFAATWGDRLERLPILPWEKLPEVYARLDINLAPLERDREFTAGKSELKYFEAALLAVPTVASHWGTYAEAIQPGVTGFLCGDSEDWIATLGQLIEDRDLRDRLGQAANQAARQRYLTRAALGETWAGWHHLLARSIPEPMALTVAVVVSLAASDSVEVDRIAALARALDAQGHEVRLVVQPFGASSSGQVHQACRAWETQLQGSGVQVLEGQTGLPALDVALATDWRSACAVADWATVRLRVRLVQNWEVDCEAPGTLERETALGSCGLPLRPIALGQALADRWETARALRVPPLWLEGGLTADFLPATPNWVRHSGPARSILWLDDRAADADQRSAIIAGLSLLAAQQPDLQIRRYGSHAPEPLPFACEELGWPDRATLAAALQTAQLHLAPSAANSALPTLQAIGCGCAALLVGEDLPLHPTLSAGIHYGTVLPVAESIAQTLLQLTTDAVSRVNLAQTGRATVETLGIDRTANELEQLLRRLLFLE